MFLKGSVKRDEGPLPEVHHYVTNEEICLLFERLFYLSHLSFYIKSLFTLHDMIIFLYSTSSSLSGFLCPFFHLFGTICIQPFLLLWASLPRLSRVM